MRQGQLDLTTDAWTDTGRHCIPGIAENSHALRVSPILGLHIQLCARHFQSSRNANPKHELSQLSAD